MKDKTIPEYYGGADNPYEVIKVINAWGLGFELANVCKYIARAGKKDKSKHTEDLEKAKKYLELEINKLKEQEQVYILKDTGNIFERDSNLDAEAREKRSWDSMNITLEEGKPNDNKDVVTLLDKASEEGPQPSTIIATSRFKYGQEVWFLENSSIRNGEVRGFKTEQYGLRHPWKAGGSKVFVHQTAGEFEKEDWVEEEHCFESREELIKYLNEETDRPSS